MQAFPLTLTHIVVSGDGHGGSGSRALLGEVVAELEDAGVVLQHAGDLHLYRVSQLLPLQRGKEGSFTSDVIITCLFQSFCILDFGLICTAKEFDCTNDISAI